MLAEKIILMLEAMSFELEESDRTLVSYILENVKRAVLNYCNLRELPEELEPAVINATCAEYIRAWKNTGKMNGKTAETVVKSVQEGDTNITFAEDEAPGKKLDRLISSMELNYSKLTGFRRLRW